MRKGSLEVVEHLRRNPPRRIKAKYGEPTGWDGLCGVFLALANSNSIALVASDRAWLRELGAKHATKLRCEKM